MRAGLPTALASSRAAALLALCLLAAGAAQAGRNCEPKALTPVQLERGMQLAERTARAFDAEHARSGAQVVVLARAGQDLTKYGLRYSHLGWVYRTPEGRWRVLHKLNECGTGVGQIYAQGLGEFFLDDLWRHEAAWMLPAPEVQQRLLPVLQDRARIKALHERAYSMVSYAWGQKYQQSNQWAAETLAGAMESSSIRTREQAQAWLRFKSYEPTTLRLGALTRLSGRMSGAHIAFDDHPTDKRFLDRIETVTVDSVFDWLQRAQLAGPVNRL